MAALENLHIGVIGLIQQDKEGRIIQLGLTNEHSQLLQLFLAQLSKENPLVRMGGEYELVLKKDVCLKCKKK